MGGLLYLAKPMAATGGLISGSFLAMAFLAIVIILIFASCIKIVPQATALVIERLGGYQDTWHVGIHVKLPFIDRVAKRVTLKEQVADFPPQPVITKDNVSIRIDTVIFYQITDPKLYAYGVENPISALENLTATTLRNIIGDLELDETLTSRETINTQMRSTLDVATDPWGIKVNRWKSRQRQSVRDVLRLPVQKVRRRQPSSLQKVRKSLLSLKQRLKRQLRFSVLKLKRKLPSVRLKVRHRLYLRCRRLMLTVSSSSMNQLLQER